MARKTKKLEVTFGQSFMDSEVKLDGKELRAQEARLVTEGGELTVLEVEVPAPSEHGHRSEVIRTAVGGPITVSVDLPAPIADEILRGPAVKRRRPSE